CDNVSQPYTSWVNLLDDLGINRHLAEQAVGGNPVGYMAVRNGFEIDELADFLSDGEIESYFFNQLVWLLEDGQACGRKVVHAWLMSLATYLAEHCAVPDEHGNTLDVRDLEYLFDNLFD